MADFGEICPLFYSGVYSEVCFPKIPMTGHAGTTNALIGTLSITASKAGAFTFGRTVVVTGAYVRNRGVAVKGEEALLLKHCVSSFASGTIFGSVTINTTQSFQEIYTYIPFTISAEKTFTSDEVLGFTDATVTSASSGVYDLIVRFREK